MAGKLKFPPDYWKNLEINRQDVESLHTHLFELETPLTALDLVPVLIAARIKSELEARSRERQANSKTYFPREKYVSGDELVFPALDWRKGRVVSTRAGVNPGVGAFEVLTLTMEDGEERMFAANLPEHALNQEETSPAVDDSLNPDLIRQEYGEEIEGKIETAFSHDEGLVQIAGRWFPRALLVDVNEGHLNLAEAVLDMAHGEPQTTAVLLKDVELPAGVNPKLAEFSLNFALQEDDRFDEVGPAGQVLWCLRRLEPEGVREVPTYLRYHPIDFDRSGLTEAMLKLEGQLDDELSELESPALRDVREVVISLIYPHLRAGTLPLSARTRQLFPTAYESPRVRFTLVDAKSGLKMPGWVVRKSGYVFGLREWYKNNMLMPGSLVAVRRGQKPGEVIIEAKTQRSSKDWIRTLIVGADGGMVFAMLKQPIRRSSMTGWRSTSRISRSWTPCGSGRPPSRIWWCRSCGS